MSTQRLWLLVPCALALGGCATPIEEDPVYIRVTEIDARVQRIERVLTNQSLLELAQRIAGYGVTPVVIGGTEERPVGAAIAKAEPKAKNLVTRPDLFQTIGLAERASFAVGDDVELMQVAAAAGAPCLVFVTSIGRTVQTVPRGRGGVVEFTAAVIADIPVDQVDRQLRNCGVYAHAATA